MRGRFLKWTCLPLGAFSMALSAAPSPVRNWLPDYHVHSLAGFQTLGDVDWTWDGDGIVARPRPEGAGGWLILDRPLQDVAAYAEFNCENPCTAGIAVRMQRQQAGGYKGDLASYGPDSGSWAEISVDAQGKEILRTQLIGNDVQSRFATPANGAPAGAAPSVPGVDSPIKPLFPRVAAPVIPIGGTADAAMTPPPPPPSTGGMMAALRAFAPPATTTGRTAASEYKAGQWNRLELFVDANIASASLNGSRRATGVTLDDGAGFGPVALYVGPGSGPVRFRNVAYKDLGRQAVPPEQVSKNFRMQKLDDYSYAWDAAVADVNRDGHNDIIAGPYVYYGPDYSVRRELYIASTYSPGNQYAGNMITYAGDFTGDGWPDVLVTEGRQMALLTNPGNEPRRWTRSMAIPGNISEITLLEDLDGDGRPELLLVQSGRVAFAQPRRSDPAAPWPVFYVSEPGLAGMHSVGVGDINGDGRKDILQSKGWWEQPAGGITAAAWTFHPYSFGNPDHPDERVEGGGNMAVTDVDGDGLNDVITSINAHGWGLAWYRQVRAGHDISFEPHLIMGDYARENPGGLTVSQLHAGIFVADVNHDGVVDFFTGKKRWAHLDSHADPDPASPAYLLLYKGVRDRKAPGGIRFEPEVIHNRSGAGSGMKVMDVDGDGAVDVVTSGVNGTFLFFGKRPVGKTVK